METHTILLEGLGGRKAVIEALSRMGITVKPDNARKWRNNGIPHKYRPAIADLAKRKKVAVPADFLRPAA